MASDRMSAALSILIARNFSKMFLRARRALEFSHGLGQQQTSPQALMALLPKRTAPMESRPIYTIGTTAKRIFMPPVGAHDRRAALTAAIRQNRADVH